LVEKLLVEAQKSEHLSKVHIIYIDKNHPVNALDKTVSMIK